MESFDEWWEENHMMVSADKTEAEDIYNLGQQSKQSEVDELRKHKEILLGELFLVSDAIQYHHVLNLLKGDQL